MIQGLKRKFVLVNMSIVTLMLVVIFGLVLHSTVRDMQERMDRNMYFLLNREIQKPDRPGPDRSSVHVPYFYVTVDDQGEILGIHDVFYDVSDTQAIAKIVRLAQNEEERSAVLKEYNLYFSRKPTPTGQLIAFLDVSNDLAILKSLIKSCLIIGGLGFLVFLGISFLLAGWAVKPVEKAWNQQRQFVADASHELKTPLTVILTNAELLADPSYPEDQRSQFVGSVLTMSHQMRGLVESLLELARVDNGTAKMVFTKMNLGSLAEETLLPFEPVFFERGLTLESRIEPEAVVWGSQMHLKQVLDILLDNGAKYSAPAGTVTLDLKKQGNNVLLSLSTPGDPIGKEDLKKIFRRFYRLDKARAMDHSYGLGLSIADSIVREHSGKIWAESEGGYNTFFVQLPGA